jgi:hypothetical protein
MLKKPLMLFFVLAFILACVFFLFPINVFDGVIVYEDHDSGFLVETPLSLSYFIGLGYEDAHMVGVKNFYLTTKGIVMAFVFILGFPALLAYRVKLKSAKK